MYNERCAYFLLIYIYYIYTRWLRKNAWEFVVIREKRVNLLSASRYLSDLDPETIEQWISTNFIFAFELTYRLNNNSISTIQRAFSVESSMFRLMGRFVYRTIFGWVQTFRWTWSIIMKIKSFGCTSTDVSQREKKLKDPLPQNYECKTIIFKRPQHSERHIKKNWKEYVKQ